MSLTCFGLSNALQDAEVQFQVPASVPAFLLSAPHTLRTMTIALVYSNSFPPHRSTDLKVAMHYIEDALIELAEKRALREVTVVWLTDLDVSNVKSATRTMLPRLHERGLLKAEAMEPDRHNTPRRITG